MRENNNILIIIENEQKLRLVSDYFTSKYKVTPYHCMHGRIDIKLKNKYIKIATPHSDVLRGYKYDIVIIDSTLEYNEDLFLISIGCQYDNDFRLIYIDISDVIEPMIKNEIQIAKKNKTQDLELEPQDYQETVF